MNLGEKEEAPLSLTDLIVRYGALARRALRYWKRAVAVFAVVLTAGVAWAAARPRTFRSEARFQVQEQERADGNGPGAEEVQRSIESRLSQVYGSRTNVATLIARLGLYPRLQGRASEAKLAQLFWGDLDRAVQADTVQLGFRYGDPAGAQRAVQGLVDLFVSARRDAAVGRARETLATVDAQLRQVEGSLAGRQESLDRFVLANPAMVDVVRARIPGAQVLVIGPAGAATAPVDRRASDRTRRLQTHVAQLAERAGSLRSAVGSAAPAEEPADLAALRERVRTKRAEAEGLRDRGLTPEHPTRAAVERELRGAQALLDAAVARHRGAAPSARGLPPAERERRLATVERELQQARGELAGSQRADRAAGGVLPRGDGAPGPADPLTRGNVVAVEAELNRLSTDLTTTRASYQDLLTRQLTARAALRRAEVGGAERIRVLDAPSRPVEPEPPGRTRLAALAALLAALCALGTALVSAGMDTRIYDRDDLRRWGELAELPFIPDLHLGP